MSESSPLSRLPKKSRVTIRMVYSCQTDQETPKVFRTVVETVRNLIGRKPIFGICLGHQILGLALGGRTYKLAIRTSRGKPPCKKAGHRTSRDNITEPIILPLTRQQLILNALSVMSISTMTQTKVWFTRNILSSRYSITLKLLQDLTIRDICSNVQKNDNGFVISISKTTEM